MRSVAQADARPYRRAFRLYNLIVAVAAVALAVYLAVWRVLPFSGPCAFATVAHLYCPGCGMTRAAEALLRFDFAASLRANPFVLLGGAVLVFYEILLFRATRGKIPARGIRGRVAIAYAVGLVLYAVARDLLLVFAQIDPLGDLAAFW